MRNMRFKKVAECAAGIGIITAAYAAGAGVIPLDFNLIIPGKASAAIDHVVVPTVEVKLIETSTVEYIEETIVETKYIDVVREVPTKLRNFKSFDELRAWLTRQNRILTVRFTDDTAVIDCDDYALEIQTRAITEGYIVSFQIIDIKQYNEMFTVQLPESQSLHAINLALIENSVYYFEPQTGEIVHAACID